MERQHPARVALVMENTLYRQGLCMLLESGGDIQVVGQATSAREIVPSVLPSAGTVILLTLPTTATGLDRSELLYCQSHAPGNGVLVVGDTLDPEEVLGLFDAGAAGYVRKESRSSALVHAIHSIAGGEFVIDGSVTGPLLCTVRDMRRRLEPSKPDDSIPLLTRRQNELLALVAAGRTNGQIATELGISESTVKNHLRQVFARLGVTSRAQAISVAVRLGLVRP